MFHVSIGSRLLQRDLISPYQSDILMMANWCSRGVGNRHKILNFGFRTS